MKVLFINGSPNPNGNTAHLANVLLNDFDYETINLVDYKLYGYGQSFEDDQFNEIYTKMQQADLIVVGSPVYWHNLCGLVRNLIDRFYGPVHSNALNGRRFVFIFQGAAPQEWMLKDGEYTMSRFATMYGMEYLGMVTNTQQAKALSKVLIK